MWDICNKLTYIFYLFFGFPCNNLFYRVLSIYAKNITRVSVGKSFQNRNSSGSIFEQDVFFEGFICASLKYVF